MGMRGVCIEAEETSSITAGLGVPLHHPHCTEGLGRLWEAEPRKCWDPQLSITGVTFPWCFGDGHPQGLKPLGEMILAPLP